MKSTFTLPYGKNLTQIELPVRPNLHWIRYNSAPAADPHMLMKRSLLQPISSPRLQELAASASKAVILVSDKSRLCPSDVFLPLLLTELNQGGLQDADISIVAAVGTHRKMTQTELIQLVGEQVYSRIKVVNHSPLGEDCVYVGTTSRGTPVEINRSVVEAGLRIATGNIEPHALVGISGGVKALFPGTASKKSISINHGYSLEIKAELGQTDNGIHEDLVEAQQFVPVHFLFNVIVNHQQEIMDCVAGDVIEAHKRGISTVRERFIVEVGQKYDTVICSAGGHPKDQNLYQAVKSLRNAAAVTRTGGRILLLAECSEHYGNPALQEWLERGKNREQMCSELKREFVLGAHKILQIDQVLRSHQVRLYSAMPSAFVELCGFQAVSDLQAELEEMLSDPGQSVAVIPHGGITFPKLKEQEQIPQK